MDNSALISGVTQPGQPHISRLSLSSLRFYNALQQIIGYAVVSSGVAAPQIHFLYSFQQRLTEGCFAIHILLCAELEILKFSRKSLSYTIL